MELPVAIRKTPWNNAPQRFWDKPPHFWDELSIPLPRSLTAALVLAFDPPRSGDLESPTKTNGGCKPPLGIFTADDADLPDE